jgi:simple sugar transport system permease protein
MTGLVTTPRGRSASLVAGAGTTARWLAALAAALVIFSAFIFANGVDPLSVLGTIWTSVLTEPRQIERILVRATPFALAALAVVVPGRAGLVNVGGEGQVIVGAVAAAGVGMWIGADAAPAVAITAMLAAAVLAGGAWAGIAAALRIVGNVNEAVTTVLLNFVALYLMLFLILGSWRDPAAMGQATSPEIGPGAKLPLLGTSGVHVGIVVAVVAALVIWFAFTRTTWGFHLTVVGGNPEAARRAGLPVTALLLSALVLGGVLAGLAGYVHLAGAEYKLRPTFGTNIGYIGFLASWLARHRPLAVLVSAVAVAAIAITGNTLQISAGLPAASVNILMGLVLVAVLGWTSSRKADA